MKKKHMDGWHGIRVSTRCFEAIKDLQERLARAPAAGLPPIEPKMSDALLAAVEAFQVES